MLYLSRKDVESLGISMKEIISVVEAGLREKGYGMVEMPPKPGIHPRPDSFIHAMPAYLKGMDLAGIKWVAGYPENRKKGLPYITGLFILNDPDTGIPLSVMDASWITAMRTGAVTAISAKYLARKESKILGIIGCGVQGRSNAEALSAIFDLSEIRAYDVNPDAAEKYRKEIKFKLGIDVNVMKSPREAVEGSDIVVTAGPILKDPKPVIEAEWFKNGGFAAPLDFDSYWKPSAMHSMDKFVTDDKNQLMYYKSIGYFREIPEVYAELDEIVVGKKPGRESDSERIMAMNLGLAIHDVVVADLIYRKAREMGIGTELEL
jgi:ornithine cyclodeaminase/alanine dehydrogenase-like protein (mu-crystallin family)